MSPCHAFAFLSQRLQSQSPNRAGSPSHPRSHTTRHTSDPPKALTVGSADQGHSTPLLRDATGVARWCYAVKGKDQEDRDGEIPIHATQRSNDLAQTLSLPTGRERRVEVERLDWTVARPVRIFTLYPLHTVFSPPLWELVVSHSAPDLRASPRHCPYSPHCSMQPLTSCPAPL